MDSIMGMDIRRRLEASLEVRVEAAQIFHRPNAAALAEHLLTRLFPPTNPTNPDVAPQSARIAGERRPKDP
jgi:hypothetical protein